MKTILFDPLPASGHVSSFLRMASYLKDRGYRCVFMGPSDHAQTVISKEFEFEIIHPFVISTEKVQIKNDGWFSFLTESVLDQINKKLNGELAISFSHYDRALEKIKPDLIILDDQYSKKAFFYSRYGLPIICLQTKVNPIKSKGIPPFQSNLIPKDNMWSATLIEISWMFLFLKRELKELLYYIVTFGNTSTRFLKQTFRESGFTLEENRCFATGIRELPMVLASPRVFDFPRPKTKNIYHFFSASTPGKQLDDLRLISIIDRRNGSGKKIIYCSLGTVTIKYERICTTFYHKIFKAAKKLSDYYFIISVGKNYDISKLSDRPQNVSVFQSVPQKELLPHVDMMISHGGMNSIMECIHAAVPMIIFPLSLDRDQPGNGARVAYHKLGYCSRLRSPTPKTLQEIILKADENLLILRENIIDFKKKVEEQSKMDMMEFEVLVDSLSSH